MIKRTTKKPAAPKRTSITAGTKITAGVQNRRTAARPVNASSNIELTPQQQMAVNQLRKNYAKMQNVMAATNTSNIMAKPDFISLLPLFVQKLIALEVYGSITMNSRQQVIPYFKVLAENTKGETHKGDIINSPFVNRQGMDPNFAGRVIKNEDVAANTLGYTPVLPGSVTVSDTDGSGNVTKLIDDGAGNLVNVSGQQVGTIDYATGLLNGVTGTVTATYQYDNETVGPDANGEYGAKMGKVYLELDEINLKAEAHELACYWSVYSAFAAQTEYGANISDMAKEAAISEITAEINTDLFAKLAKAASYKPQFNWDASPVLSGAVVPHDYLNMFKLKLGQAAASTYQATRLTRPNKLIVGTNTAEFIAMIDGFTAENISDTAGPYKFGKLDQFDIYVDPNYDLNSWVLCCHSDDIRRSSALFGEYMPMASTDAIGLADMSVQQGVATMYAAEIVNPATICSGKILGTF